MQNTFNKFTSDVLIIGGTNILNSLSGFIFLPLITKTLGTQVYGIWTQINVVTVLFIGFVGLGMPFALVRFLPAKTDKDEIRDDFFSVFSLVFLSTLIISVSFIAAAEPIAKYFFDGEVNVVRISGLIIISLSFNSVLMSYLRSFRMMKAYALYSLTDTYGQIGIITVLVLNGHGIISMALTMLIVKTVLTSVLLFLIIRKIGFSVPRFTRIKQYLILGLALIPGNICSWIVNTSSRLIIAGYLGIAAVGIYSAAYSIGSILYMISGIIGFVLTPSIAKLYDEKKMEELKIILSYTLKYILALCIPLIAGSAMLAYPILKLLTTEEIASQGSIVLVIQTVSSVLMLVSIIFMQVLVLTLKTKMLMIPWIIAAMANIVLNIVLVPWIGIMGSAIGTLVSFLILLIIRVVYSVKEFKFPIDWKFIIKSTFASGVMGGCIWLIQPKSDLATIYTVISSILIYIIMIIILKGFSKNEFRFFTSYFRQLITHKVTTQVKKMG